MYSEIFMIMLMVASTQNFSIDDDRPIMVPMNQFIEANSIIYGWAEEVAARTVLTDFLENDSLNQTNIMA